MRGTTVGVRPTLVAGWYAVVILVISPSAERGAAAQAPVAAIARIESLAQAGADSAALTLADSILADTDPGASTYADALYWRGTLRRTPDARMDLIRLTVDYPTHPRAGDALYALAREDLASGNRDLAVRRLDRIVRDFMSSDVGPRGAAEAGRIHLARGQMSAACAAFDSALAHISGDDIEFRNRTAYDARPCERWKEMVADSVAKAASSAPPAGRGAAGAAKPPAESGRWTVQVAALATRPEAERLRARLVSLGYAARVALKAPFRVRVGRFGSRSAATDVVAKLKRQRFAAIVVEAERP